VRRVSTIGEGTRGLFLRERSDRRTVRRYQQDSVPAGGAVMLARTATNIISLAPPQAVRHGWHQLAILAALMGFASISTDLYLPAMPAMGAALNASTGSVEWTISG